MPVVLTARPKSAISAQSAWSAVCSKLHAIKSNMNGPVRHGTNWTDQKVPSVVNLTYFIIASKTDQKWTN